MSAPRRSPPHPAARPPRPRTGRRFHMLLLVHSGIAVVLAVWSAYAYQVQQTNRSTQQQLALVAELKRDQLSAWLDTETRMATEFGQGTLVAPIVERWTRTGSIAPDVRAVVLTRIRTLQAASGMDDVSILALDGRLLASSTGLAFSIDQGERHYLDDALRTGGAVVTSVHRDRDRPDHPFSIDIVTPLVAIDGAGRRPVAFVLFRIDPSHSLFPLLQRWPLPSATSETLLLERQGNELLVLNEARHRPGSALALRIPMDRRCASVLAAEGAAGLIEAQDYRGVPVLASALPVPGTPWLLLAKVDRAEVLQDVWVRTARTSAVAVVLVLAAALLVRAWFRQRAASLVLASEERYRSLFDGMVDAVFLVGVDGRLLDVNRVASESLGYSREELLRMTAVDLDPEQAARKLAWARAAPPELRENVFTTCHHRKDGTSFPVEISARRVQTGAGPAYLAVARDITERLRAERAVRESEALLSAIFENAGFAISVTGLDGRFMQINARWAEFLGYTPEELRAITAREITHPEDLEASDELWGALVRGEIPSYELEKRYVRKDGGVVWGLLSATPLRDPAGNVRNVIGIVADVTERKLMQEALSIAAERLSLATEGAGIGIWDWDVTRNEVVWDDAMYRLYGVRREAFPRAYDAWIRALDPGDLARAREVLRATLRGEREISWEAPIRWPDGSIHHVHANAKTIRGEDGRVLRVVGINYDVTPRKAAEQETARNMAALRAAHLELERLNGALAERTRQAEAASRAKSDFLANMSHEIRTPLNAVVGLSHLLLETDLPARERDYLRRIQAASQTLLDLISDILDLSKIEAEKLELDRAPFELGNVIERISSLLGVKARQKGLALTFTVAADVPERLVGDALRLGQVLLNLTSNAIKFTERGGVSVEVRPAAAGGDRAGVRFSVEDTGCGIAPDVVPSLFRPFSQGDGSSTRRHGGTGLGLSISKRLVDLMGGELVVESTVGRGSTFSFELPLERAAADDEPPRRPTAAARAPARGRRVLVAEDNETNRMIVRELLRGTGVEVVEASNGREAVELAVAPGAPVDVVLMDIQMPEMDGLEATARIRRERPDVPIIAMTAHALEEERRRCVEAGMNGHVAKPFEPSTLWRVLERWLGLAPPPERPAALGEALRATVARDLASGAAALRDARAAGDTVRAGRAAHALKGLPVPGGGAALHAAARGAEEAIRGGGAWREAVQRLEREAEAVQAALARAAPEGGAPAVPDGIDGDAVARALQDIDRALRRRSLSAREPVAQLRTLLGADARVVRLEACVARVEYVSAAEVLRDLAEDLGLSVEPVA